MQIFLIRSFVFSFEEIDEGFVNHFISAGSWIISCKIPIAKMIRYSFMKVFNRLENNFYLIIYIGWFKHLSHLCRNFFNRKRIINSFYMIHNFFSRKVNLLFAFPINLLNQILFVIIMQQFNNCFESSKVANFCHINSITI